MPNHEPYVFYKLLPDGRFELYVDASLMKDFDICERYFWFKHIKNVRPRGFMVAKPFPMAIGSWWSDAMEMFYNHLRDGTDISKDRIQEIALTSWAKNNIEASAAADPKKFKSFGDIAGAVLMLQEYHDSQFQIDRQNWKIVSVEEGFGLKKEVPLGETRRCVVYWVGKPDTSAVEDHRLLPVDHKTTEHITANTGLEYKPGDQMIGYVHSFEVIAKSLGIDTRVDRCVVNVCARSRPTDKPRNGGSKRPRFQRFYPNYTRDEINEWKRDVLARCDRMVHCLTTGEWNWRKTACTNVYKRVCDFHDIDSKTPTARDIVLAANFQEGIAWKPYEPIEEEV